MNPQPGTLKPWQIRPKKICAETRNLPVLATMSGAATLLSSPRSANGRFAPSWAERASISLELGIGTADTTLSAAVRATH